MNISINKLKNRIVGTVNTVKFNVAYSDIRFDTLNQEAELLSICDDAEEYYNILGDFLLLVKSMEDSDKEENSSLVALDFHNSVYMQDGIGYLKSKTDLGDTVVSTIPIPKSLMDRIIQAKEQGLEVSPFIKAWILFLRNPNFSPEKAELFGQYLTANYVDDEIVKELVEDGYTVEKATELATFNEVSVTKAGLIQTYKYVKHIGFKKDDLNFETAKAEDYIFLPPVMGRSGDPVLCNGSLTHNVEIGAIHELNSWGQVNCNDDMSCVKGLECVASL